MFSLCYVDDTDKMNYDVVEYALEHDFYEGYVEGPVLAASSVQMMSVAEAQGRVGRLELCTGSQRKFLPRMRRGVNLSIENLIWGSCSFILVC